MDLRIKDQLFIVCGATQGLGNSVAMGLINEGAKIIAIARNSTKLAEMKNNNPDQVETLAVDLTSRDGVDEALLALNARTLHGVFLNAAGPPAKTFLETHTFDWDNAFASLLRWKVRLVKKLIPYFVENSYGRILFSESIAIKQPLENLVLSNSLRMAVAGVAKTLSNEVADKGITVNVLAPGYHDTDAMNRLYEKKSRKDHISINDAKAQYAHQTTIGQVGNTETFAALSLFLLSPLSNFITGQIISVDGGVGKGIF